MFILHTRTLHEQLKMDVPLQKNEVHPGQGMEMNLFRLSICVFVRGRHENGTWAFCFNVRILDIVAATNKGYMVWQEVFDNEVKVTC